MSLDATHRHCTRDKDSTDEQIATADVNKKKSSIFRHSFERLAVGGSADQGHPSKLEERYPTVVAQLVHLSLMTVPIASFFSFRTRLDVLSDFFLLRHSLPSLDDNQLYWGVRAG